MSQTYTEPTALDRLPSAAADVLQRGDKSGNRLTEQQVELIADELLQSGIQQAPNLAWMAKLIRHKLGVGDFSSPPAKLARDAAGYRLAQDRAVEITARVRGIVA